MLLDVLSSPWLIIPESLDLITEICSRRMRGEIPDFAAIEAAMGKPLQNTQQGYTIMGEGVAVIPWKGPMARHMNLVQQISGGVSTDLLIRDINAAENDPKVHSRLLWIDSPGGTVEGTQAVADTIFNLRGGKPTVALGDGKIGSAAYIAGSAVRRGGLYLASDTTLAGSVGVRIQHIDRSKQNEAEGIRVTDISAGKFKSMASDNAPLSGEGFAMLQAQADYIYQIVLGWVGRHRGAAPEEVHDRMGDGRIFIGKQAITAGLADGFSTLPDLVAQLDREQAARSRAFLGGVR